MSDTDGRMYISPGDPLLEIQYHTDSATGVRRLVVAPRSRDSGARHTAEFFTVATLRYSLERRCFLQLQDIYERLVLNGVRILSCWTDIVLALNPSPARIVLPGEEVMLLVERHDPGGNDERISLALRKCTQRPLRDDTSAVSSLACRQIYERQNVHVSWPETTQDIAAAAHDGAKTGSSTSTTSATSNTHTAPPPTASTLTVMTTRGSTTTSTGTSGTEVLAERASTTTTTTIATTTVTTDSSSVLSADADIIPRRHPASAAAAVVSCDTLCGEAATEEAMQPSTPSEVASTASSPSSSSSSHERSLRSSYARRRPRHSRGRSLYGSDPSYSTYDEDEDDDAAYGSSCVPLFDSAGWGIGTSACSGASSLQSAFSGWSGTSGGEDGGRRRRHCYSRRRQRTHAGEPLPKMRTPLHIFPYVAEYRSAVLHLVPLLDAAAEQRQQEGEGAAGHGSSDTGRTEATESGEFQTDDWGEGGSVAAAAPPLYVTDKGRDVLRQQQEGPRQLSPGFMLAMRTIDTLNRHYDITTDTFLPFSLAEKRSLLCDFFETTRLLRETLRSTPPVLRLASPVFCAGDLHGSFADMRTVFSQVAVFGNWVLPTLPVLFLGDYVDRGANCAELVMMLFARAIASPAHVWMLRGNHEDREVNGNEEDYGPGSFLYLSKRFFGPEAGVHFWEMANQVFELLPVAAVIDGSVFACHGGIPLLASHADDFDDLRRGCDNATNIGRRRWSSHSNKAAAAPSPGDSRVPLSGESSHNMFYDFIPTEADFEAFLQLNSAGRLDSDGFRFSTVLPLPGDTAVVGTRRRLVRELLWNDPAPAEDAFFLSQNPDCPLLRYYRGFRCNRSRGDDCGMIREFNQEAVERFLARFGFTLLIRAHQQKPDGVEMAQGGRIVTVFSCCNYNQHVRNHAGACVIAEGEIKLVSWYAATNNHRAPNIDTTDSASATLDGVTVQVSNSTTTDTTTTSGSGGGAAVERHLPRRAPPAETPTDSATTVASTDDTTPTTTSQSSFSSSADSEYYRGRHLKTSVHDAATGTDPDPMTDRTPAAERLRRMLSVATFTDKEMRHILKSVVIG